MVIAHHWELLFQERQTQSYTTAPFSSTISGVRKIGCARVTHHVKDIAWVSIYISQMNPVLGIDFYLGCNPPLKYAGYLAQKRDFLGLALNGPRHHRIGEHDQRFRARKRPKQLKLG